VTLIVEDGTGKADAESVASVAELDTYLAARGLPAVAATETKEVALRFASEYADTAKRYKGTTQYAAQALMFPRADLTDWSGHAVTGVPLRYKQAVLFLASQVLAGEPLYENLSGPQVVSESVGPISVSYESGQGPDARHRVFTAFDRLVAQYVRDPSMLRASPGWTAPEGAKTFSTGMHDLDAVASDEVG